MAARTTKKSGAALERLRADLKAGSPANVYIFYGEETYLRDRYLEELRQLLGAGVIISSSLSLYYAPVMLVLGLVMGALTSITLKALLPALGRLGFSTREKRGE